MKTSIDVINSNYDNVFIINKDIGNRGYYIKGYNDDKSEYFEYLSKKQIIRLLTRWTTNERMIKLITIQIMNE
jgi:hypothetical protein